MFVCKTPPLTGRGTSISTSISPEGDLPVDEGRGSTTPEVEGDDGRNRTGDGVRGDVTTSDREDGVRPCGKARGSRSHLWFEQVGGVTGVDLWFRGTKEDSGSL